MTTQQPHRIEPGQEYAAHNARENTTTRIRVTSRPYPGWHGNGQVDIVTIGPDGRRLRPRAIAVSKLHADPTRKTGYQLVQNPDGTPATQEGTR